MMLPIATLLAAASALPIGPQPGQSHSACLRSSVTALEVSGAPALEVAKSTVLACASLEPKPTKENILGQMTLDDRIAVIRRLREAFEGILVLRVVSVRACRKTPSCDPKTVPWTGLTGD